MAVFSVSLHAIFPWFVSMSKFYSYFKDTRHIGSGPTLRASFNLFTPAKVLVFKYVTFWSLWGLEFHHEPFLVADTIHPMLISQHPLPHCKNSVMVVLAEVSGPLLVLLLPSDIFFAIKKIASNRLSFMRAADPVFVSSTRTVDPQSTVVNLNVWLAVYEKNEVKLSFLILYPGGVVLQKQWSPICNLGKNGEWWDLVLFADCEQGRWDSSALHPVKSCFNGHRMTEGCGWEDGTC